MSRLAATLRLDFVLQQRNQVIPVVAGVGLLLGGLLRAFGTPAQIAYLMPLAALSGIGITALVLVGVLLMLERSEGTLDVVLVSPLRSSEYLASKLLSVTALAVAEGLVVALVAHGPGFRWPLLLLALALRASTVAAVGVAIAARFRSLTEFLPPAALVMVASDLPVASYLGLWTSPVFYALPTFPTLLLAKAAFAPVSGAELAYAGVGAGVALAAAAVWATRSLDHFVVQGGAEARP